MWKSRKLFVNLQKQIAAHLKIIMSIVIYGIQQELFPDNIDSRNIQMVDPDEDFHQDVFDGFFTIKEAAKWASDFLKRNVTNANISYLINYGKIKKYTRNNAIVVMKDELEESVCYLLTSN